MFNHILVAVDGSAHSDSTLSTATEVAKKFEAEVTVVHFIEHEVGRSSVYRLESVDEAKKIVAAAIKKLKAAGIKTSSQVNDVAHGHAAKAIVDIARERSVNLIVIGSRGHSEIEGLLLGSVTHKVIQLAHIPVLVDRRPAEK
jgi:nucleotide-binding universal stress UspA family protein